jgi:hypothetical protein
MAPTWRCVGTTRSTCSPTTASTEPFLSVDTGSSLLVIAVFLAGFIVFQREDRWTLALVTVPIGLSLIASGLRLYSVGGRVSLFALPALAIVPKYMAVAFVSRTTLPRTVSPRTLVWLATTAMPSSPVNSQCSMVIPFPTKIRTPFRPSMCCGIGHPLYGPLVGSRVWCDVFRGPSSPRPGRAPVQFYTPSGTS